jgi:hypothetical protein
MRLVIGIAAAAAVALCLTPTGSPARADGYDPSALCPSPAPSGADLGPALATIRTNTATAIGAAQGFTLRHRGLDDSLFTYDAHLRQSRVDNLRRDGSTVHRIMDGVTGRRLTGHLVADGADEAAALRVLQADAAWVATAAPAPTVTAPGLISAGLDGSALHDLALAAASAAAPRFTCSGDGATLTVTQTDDGDESPSHTYTFDFTEAGALASLAVGVTVGGAPIGTVDDTFTYGPESIVVPAPTSKRRWERAVVQGSFLQVRTATALAARNEVAALTTASRRVAAVRRIARRQARFYDTKHISAKNLKAGVRITAKEPWAQAWFFTVTVTGPTIRITTNLT